MTTTITVWQCFVFLIILGILSIILKHRAEILDWIFKNNDKKEIKEELVQLSFYKKEELEDTTKYFNMKEVNSFTTIGELNTIIEKIKEDYDLIIVLNFNGKLYLANFDSEHTFCIDKLSELKDIVEMYELDQKFDIRVFLDEIVCKELELIGNIKLSFLTPLHLDSNAVILVSITQDLKE